MPENEKQDSLNPDELALIGKVEKEFTHYDNKFKMHTLNSRENLFALKHTLNIEDALVKYDMLKKGTLIYCIDSRDGKVLSLKDKEELIYGLQPALVDELYDSYLSMLAEQGRLLEELKKKLEESEYNSPLFVISSFYKLPVNDPRIRDMSPIEQMWTLLNINHEKTEVAENRTQELKLLCTVTNPEVADQIFAPKDDTVNIGFREQLEMQQGRKLTDEEFEQILLPKNEKEKFDEVSSVDDLDEVLN